MKVTDDIKYVGVNDHQIDLFEGQYIVPRGMAYNSYVILDEKIVVMDTVDQHFGDEWLANLAAVLGDRKPDYLIVQHMEPDHSANIVNFLKVYPDAVVVGNAKTFSFMEQFYGKNDSMKKQIVKNGEELCLGRHVLKFVLAPMVHWPEVMFTYDSTDKVLFSADAFGKFGANDVEDPEGWSCEARRYYFGIVGKYGLQTTKVLKAAAALDIQTICPLHGSIQSGAPTHPKSPVSASHTHPFTDTPRSPSRSSLSFCARRESRSRSATWQEMTGPRPLRTHSAMTDLSLQQRPTTTAFSLSCTHSSSI